MQKVFQKTQAAMSYAYLFKYIIIGDTGEWILTRKNFLCFHIKISIDFPLFTRRENLPSTLSCLRQIFLVQRSRSRDGFSAGRTISPFVVYLTVMKCVLRLKICLISRRHCQHDENENILIKSSPLVERRLKNNFPSRLGGFLPFHSRRTTRQGSKGDRIEIWELFKTDGVDHDSSWGRVNKASMTKLSSLAPVCGCIIWESSHLSQHFFVTRWTFWAWYR